MADTSPAADPAAHKKRLRKQAKQQRAIAAAATPDAGERLRDHLLGNVTFPPDVAVSAYWPMRDEIDPLPTLHALHARGHPIGLPTMPGNDRPLEFRAWYPEQALVDGGFGTRIPPETAAPLVPQILLVPMLAFDRRGYRLGYGGGFYDRTLEQLRAANSLTRAIGIVYADQEVAEVPTDAYDQRLDMLVSERGVIDLSGGR